MSPGVTIPSYHITTMGVGSNNENVIYSDTALRTVGGTPLF